MQPGSTACRARNPSRNSGFKKILMIVVILYGGSESAFAASFFTNYLVLTQQKLAAGVISGHRDVVAGVELSEISEDLGRKDEHDEGTEDQSIEVETKDKVNSNCTVLEKVWPSALLLIKQLLQKQVGDGLSPKHKFAKAAKKVKMMAKMANVFSKSRDGGEQPTLMKDYSHLNLAGSSGSVHQAVSTQGIASTFPCRAYTMFPDMFCRNGET